MKHWDLTPKEIVTMTCLHDGRILRARFLFHTTTLACFMVLRIGNGGSDSWGDKEGKFTEFELQDDGTLRDRRSTDEIIRTLKTEGFSFDYNSRAAADIAEMRRRRWRINGPDRNTRHTVE